MTETIGLLVIALSILAIIHFMFRGLRSPAGTAGGLFAGFGSTGSLGGFAGGLVASIAASTTLAATSAGVGAAGSIGAALGVAYFILSRLRWTLGIRIVSGTIGTAGLIALIVFVITGSGCASVALWQRLVIIGLVIVAGALGVVSSLFIGRPRLPSTLAAFGAVKIAVFLAAPLGVSLLALPVAAWVVAFAAAMLLGGLSAIAPQFVIGLAGAVIAVASLMSGTIYGDTCTAGPDFSDLAALVGFAAVYVVLTIFLGRWVAR